MVILSINKKNTEKKMEKKCWINMFARGPYYHLFKRYVIILLRKMRIETKTVPST